MSSASRLQWIFLLNATVLITHQIDAAYWHEWELFRIPGGNQVNLILNLPILILVLYAHRVVAANGKAAAACHKLLAGLGLLTAAIHSCFFLLGDEAFMQPVSIALLAATAVLSIFQVLTLRVSQPA